MTIRAVALSLGLVLSSQLTVAGAAPFSLASGSTQVALIELYTSEGCSSCPPADRWLSGLKDDPRLWKEVVPVAFHVDYWDYIGWKDRFASPEYSARQRNYARQQSVRAVYTPGFVYNGEEWRQWFSRRYDDVPRPREAGVLEVVLNAGQAVVRYHPPGANGDLKANLVLLGGGLSTQVKAGENRGRRLEHDFVVLGLVSAPLVHNEGAYTMTLELPATTVRAERYALAAWVSHNDAQAVLQSVGGWLPDNQAP